MKPSQQQSSPFEYIKACSHSTLPAISKSLVAFALLLTISGCATKKQTWQDWMNTRQASKEVHDDQAVTPTPAFPTNALVFAPDYKVGDGAMAGPGFDLAMRNPDFPETYIEAVHIDLSHPADGVRIKWAGPHAADGPTGPWCFTPGKGGVGLDCDDDVESNIVDSRCTPKGVFPVVGFADHLRLTPICLYATWVLYAPRFIAIHSHTQLPKTPASSGCIRMPYSTAKLIHNNSKVGVTLIHIYGTWQSPSTFKTYRPITISNNAPLAMRALQK